MPLQRPIASLLASDAYGIPFQVKVDVVPMTKALAKQWHETVQPIVNSHYSHHGSASKKIRADVGWRWPNYLKLVAITSPECLVIPQKEARQYVWLFRRVNKNSR